MLEMLSSFKQLKGLGWESLITKKNTDYRVLENKYNKKIFLLNSVYTFIVNFAPPLAILLTFVIDLAVSGQSKFSTTQVYSIITYIALIQAPLNNLPSTIVLGIQTIASCRRINHFFNAE